MAHWITSLGLTLPRTTQYIDTIRQAVTCDPSPLKNQAFVRSAIHKQETGWLFVEWETVSESQLSYVSAFCLPVLEIFARCSKTHDQVNLVH